MGMWPSNVITREQLRIPASVPTLGPLAPFYCPTSTPPPCQSDHDEPEWVAMSDLDPHGEYLETP